MGSGFRSGNGHIQPWKLPVSFNEFHGWIWPFPNLKPDPINQEWHSLCPRWGILMGQFVSTGFWGHWVQIMGGKWEKTKKMIFQAFMVTSRSKKIDLKTRFWCSLGPWWDIGICKFVSECLFGFSRQLEGSKLSSTKIWHFCPDIHKVNGALEGEVGCHP